MTFESIVDYKASVPYHLHLFYKILLCIQKPYLEVSSDYGERSVDFGTGAILS